MLHAASLSLHLQRKLRSERRTLHRAWDPLAFTEQRCCTRVQGFQGSVLHMSNGNAMFDSVAISITSAKEVRDSEGCFVRNAGWERRFWPVFGRR